MNFQLDEYKEGSDGIPQALSSLGNWSPFSLPKNPLKKTVFIRSLRPLLTNLQFSSFLSFLQFAKIIIKRRGSNGTNDTE